MANINIDSRIMKNLQSENIAQMINNVIDAELSKDVSQMNTELIDECVDLLIEIEKEKDNSFNALIPLTSSDKFLDIINHKHSGWKSLNVFARAAVIAAVIAGSTFTVNAAVGAVTDINILGEISSAVVEQLEDWGIIHKPATLPDDRPIGPETKPTTTVASTAPVIETEKKHPEHPTHPEHPAHPEHPTHPQHPTKPEENTTGAVEESTTSIQEESPSVVPVTKEEPTEQTTSKATNDEDVTAATKPHNPVKPSEDTTHESDEVQLVGLSVDSSGMKKEYIYNEAVDYTGLKLYARYSDGTKEEISINDTAHTRKVDTTKVGEYKLRITYGNCTVTITITIRPDEDTTQEEIKRTDEFEYILTDKGAYITKYFGTSTSIVLDNIEGNDIYAIGNGVFKDSNITYFASNTAQKIFESAFSGCSELENAITPCATYIGANAYMDCSKLKDAIFAYNLSYIGAHAYERTSIESISLPSSITEVPEYLCNQCENLTRVELGGSVTTIGNNAFNECHALEYVSGTAEIAKVQEAAFYEDELLEMDSNLPKLEYAGDISFAYCKKLDFGKLSENIKHIGDSAFQYCYKLTEVRITSAIDEIPHCAFQGAHIDKLTIDEGVEHIGEYAFMSTNLTEVELPKSLKKIGTYAFYIAKLRTVSGGRNVEEIGSNAFYRTSRLTMNVTENSEMHIYAKNNNINFVITEKTTSKGEEQEV